MPATPPEKPGTFGERLKREREMRGVKLEEIAESTKIGKRNLVALEEEHFDQLPGGIFNKGFVRAYAKFLGLDEEQAVNDFMAASANYEQPAALQPPSLVKPPAMPSEATERRQNQRWVFAAVIALVAGFAIWFYITQRGRLHRANADAAGQTRPASSQTKNSAPVNSGPNSAPVAAADKTTAQSSARPSAATQTAPNSATNTPTPPTADTSNSAAKKEFTLSVHATEDTWIAITADGKLLADAVIAKGKTEQFRAKKELTLKTGNAGGLEIEFNGAVMPPLGQPKQVKTVTYTPAGLQQ